MDKRNLGQYFTVGDPFSHAAFTAWLKRAQVEKSPVLEPFAGSNNLVKMLRQAGLQTQFVSYDIAPSCPEVLSLDTLADFPQGYRVAITNPPYLARNSAKRRGLSFPVSAYDDLYKYALDVMLENVAYVAAIVPDSLLTSALFLDRAVDFISLNTLMFDDTTHPVCLALFEPVGRTGGPNLWLGNKLVGPYKSVWAQNPVSPQKQPWIFNHREGQIGLRGLDDQKTRTIRFVPGEEINGDSIKVSTRAITRIFCAYDLSEKQRDALVQEANVLLNAFRDKTGDMTLTSFKGLRQDGMYRKRLDFKMARAILDTAWHNCEKNNVFD